ncbi:MAG TPA: hypothetical protein VG817_04740, partial [Gemmatimonadales bacterium]|nr:hypothetical protein [Gemmatimonadales bacterium]
RVAAGFFSWRLGRRRQAARLLGRPPEQEFELTVQRTQVVRRPALQDIMQLRVDPQQESVPFRHNAPA